MTPAPLLAVVAIPARNEEARLGRCLESLLRQVGMPASSLGIVVFVNGCTDATAEVAWRALSGTRSPSRVIVDDAAQTDAGSARRRAMDAAAAWLGEDGDGDRVILTTDADTMLPPGWVRANLTAIAQGADLVAGNVTLDPVESARLPVGLHARGRLESEYQTLLTEIRARHRPDPSNPWPHHATASGASLAVRRSTYLRVGGLPALACGEDRAFVNLVRARGARVRHALDVAVVTSARLDGRARGGAADTMRQRSLDPDSPCDADLEPMHRVVQRLLSSPAPGDGGRRVDVLSPRALPREIRLARLLVGALRARDAVRARVVSVGRLLAIRRWHISGSH